jgi:hypothetical protein
MVRDGSSGNDRQPPAEPARGAAGGSPVNPGPPPNLTHELAQLLAASIAQNQAAGRGMPTGADLASLASLVSAASGQRTLAPVFRDGLSALAYKAPHGTEGAGPQQDDGAADDEPMPIPSTWRQPSRHDEDRWLRQQMGAALLGLLAGLMIVVPAVLWLSGWLGPSRGKPPAEGQPMAVAASAVTGEARPTEVKTVKVQVRPVDTAAQYVTGSIDRPAAQAAPPEPAAPPAARVAEAKPTEARAAEPRSALDELLANAARRIEAGDVTGAREVLAGSEAGVQGPAVFALAETYDPNMLAAWGTRGVGSDVARARALYAKALNMGVARAQSRLDALR